MTDEEFLACLEDYGGDLRAWPATLAIAGHRQLRRSEVARSLLQDMVLIETGLARAEPRPPPGLSERILSSAFADAASDRRRCPLVAFRRRIRLV